MTNVTIDLFGIVLYNTIIKQTKEIKIMNEYIISTSFNKSNQDAWWLSCKAYTVSEVIDSQMIEGYELYVNYAYDEAIVKYPENIVYFIFRIN